MLGVPFDILLGAIYKRRLNAAPKMISFYGIWNTLQDFFKDATIRYVPVLRPIWIEINA